MVNEKEKWGFTDQIDWPRVCRELHESGCAVGLVTTKGEDPLTLVDWGARVYPPHALQAAAAFKNGDGYLYKSSDGCQMWVRYRGDWVKAFLDVKSVTVKGYK